MTREKLRKIAYALILFIQISLIGAVFYLEQLTKKSAGVMHHIYYRKAQYEQTVFSSGNMHIHRAALIALAGYFAFSAIRSVKKEKSKFWKVQNLLGLVISGFALAITYLFTGKIAYHYFIAVFEIVLAMQFLIVTIGDSKHL